MGEEEVDQLPSTTTATVAAPAAGSGNKYFHESIKNIEIAIYDDEQDEYEYDFMHMVDDPLEQTTVAIMITINRYIDDYDNSSTTERSYDLKGFLKDDTPNELDDLLGDKTVTPRTLKKVKKALLKRRYSIKKVALKYLSFEKIIVNMKLDLLMSYSDHKEDLNVDDDDDDDDDDNVEEEILVDDDDDDDEEMFETDDEEMNGETFDEYDDDNVSWKPALRSSAEALETRTVKNKEDFAMMLKISSCGNKSCRVCLEEFLFDDAAGGTITIKAMPCSHIFHSECINKWLEKKHTCPTCRWEMPTADH